MISQAQRHRFCSWLIDRARTRGHELTDADLRLPALVVAPHPDDEALACGGTILRKTQLGARVRLLFMTDGSRSHPGLIEPDRLREIRRGEALAAAALMGVAANDVVFLDFDDAHLAAQRSAATERVREIIRATSPTQVFAPYARDINPDHVATNRIVHAALRGCRPRPRLYEYTVYLWGRWPWSGKAGVSGRAYRLWIHALPGMIRCAAFAVRFRDFVGVESVLDRKRDALAAHRSQMSPIAPGAWTIPKVSGGELVQWHFCGSEFFRARQ